MSDQLDILREAYIHERLLAVALWYPTVESNVNEIEIDLVDVRAADPLRISYDFERDGWSVKQQRSVKDSATGTSYELDDGDEWVETAFLKG